jgi:hypothetical protein
VAVQAQEYEEMPTMRNAAIIIAGASLAGLLALAARAAEPGATTGGPQDAGAAAVTPAEPTVLPNAPKVGDTAPGAGIPNEAEAKSAAGADGSPDWPCVQRKMTTISSGQIWDGPPIDGVKGWEKDEKIQELTTYLESRRISLDDAGKAIKEFAESQPAGERDKKLTELFASVLSKINSDRQFVIGRIEEFQRRQKARAEEIQREGDKLAQLNQTLPADEQAGPRDTKLTPEQTEYNWDTRIFQERQQNLTVACDIPVLIEQRAYEIAKLIRAQMQS